MTAKSANVVPIAEFNEYFDSKLLNCYRFDLCNIIHCLDTIVYLISQIIKKTDFFKQTSGGSNKILKVVDQIEGLSLLESKVSQILPDSEYLRDFNTKFKTKLKSIDETLATSKLFRKDQDWINNAIDIRGKISTVLLHLEQLETYHNQRIVSSFLQLQYTFFFFSSSTLHLLISLIELTTSQSLSFFPPIYLFISFLSFSISISLIHTLFLSSSSLL